MRIKCTKRTNRHDSEEQFIPGRYYTYVNGDLGPSEAGVVFKQEDYGDVLLHLAPWYEFSTKKRKFNGLEKVEYED